jgi:hypothetical protein
MSVIAGLNAALTDRYRVERELGPGGMATVYLAEDAKHIRRLSVPTTCAGHAGTHVVRPP